MIPNIGWYRRSKWLETFRPGDGRGHITITGGDNPPEDIAFDDIVCDICNADAGGPNVDGTDVRIFFDGCDGLCAECGEKAERQLLADMVAGIKAASFVDGYKATDVEAMGMLIARFFEWDGASILRAAQHALGDANFHGESAMVSAIADGVDKADDGGSSAAKKRTQGGSR